MELDGGVALSEFPDRLSLKVHFPRIPLAITGNQGVAIEQTDYGPCRGRRIGPHFFAVEIELDDLLFRE